MWQPPAWLRRRVKGRVADKDQRPIEGATVVMQTPDSVFVDGVTTDSLGCFVFHRTLKRYRLIFQHLLYKSVVKDYDAAGDMGVVTMDEQGAYALGEVVVSAERPLVKAGAAPDLTTWKLWPKRRRQAMPTKS